MKTRLITFLAMVACACDDGSLGSVVAGVRVEGAPVEFGKALENTQLTKSIFLVGTGRASVSVELFTESPFAAPGEVVVPGGGRVEVPIEFTAGSTSVEGVLRVSAQGKSLEVELRGRGVRPQSCVPSAVCRVSSFDLALEACVESIAADGATCTPDSVCLDNGLCKDGACLGSARACDDQNLCTDDSCAEGSGCVHTEAACPSSGNPCLAPICDPLAGCGEAPVLDGVLCGAVDCVDANLCIAGHCTRVDTPEGFLCAPPTPCQGEGRCQAKECVRPDAGVLELVNAALLSAGPEGGRLLAAGGNLYLELCDGADAGCRLSSMTETGFLRFETMHADPSPRRLVNVTSTQVLVLSEHGFEAFSSSDGAALWSLPFASDAGWVGRSATDRVSWSADGGYFATVSWQGPADGGGTAGEGWEQLLSLDEDGGLLGAWELSDAGTQSLLALDQGGKLGLYDPTGPFALAAFDGGEVILSTPGQLGGEACFAAAGETFVAGAKHLVQADGGTQELSYLDDAGQALEVLPWTLAANGRGFGIYRSCLQSGPGCAPDERSTILRAFDASDAGTLWESTVLPGGLGGRLEEAALVAGGGVITLTELSPDAGGQAHVQLFSAGKRLLVCPLPEGQQLGGAVFDRGLVHVAASRDGGWRLESYDLKGIPLETRGWPQRDGVSGQRRAR